MQILYTILKIVHVLKKTSSENTKVNTFINKNSWAKNNVLPNEANAVFFGDNVILSNINNTFLNFTNNKISFDKYGGTNLKLLSIYSRILIDKITYGDHISLNITDNNNKNNIKCP